MTPEASVKRPVLTVRDFSLAVEFYQALALENRSREEWQRLFGKFFENLPKPRQDELGFFGLDLEAGCPFVVYYNQETGRPSTKFEVSAGKRKVNQSIVDYSYGKTAKEEKLGDWRGRVSIGEYTHPITNDVFKSAQIMVTEVRVADENWQPERKFGHAREVVVLGKWQVGMEEPPEMVVLERSDFIPLNPGAKHPTFVEIRRTFPLEGDSADYINLAALEGKTNGRMVLARPEGKGKKGKIAGHKPPSDLDPARVVKY